MVSDMYEGHRKHKYTEWPHAGCSSGFTLLELMVTVAVAGVLMTVAIPAYQGMVQRNTMTSVVNSLVGAINYARSEAVTRGTRVAICASKDQTNCNGSWLGGWIVYVVPNDPNASASEGELLRAHGVVTVPRITISDDIDHPIKFDGSGFAFSSPDTLTLCSKDTYDKTSVVISRTGRVSTEDDYHDSASSC